MTFARDAERFTVKLDRATRAVYVATAAAVQESVKTGRPETGAPGQPVDIGNLRNSWTLDVGPAVATIATNAAYARAIEDGVGRFGPLTRRSRVGGFHSVKLTIAGFDRLLRSVVREVTG